jgi:hypothetical protein
LPLLEPVDLGLLVSTIVWASCLTSGSAPSQSSVVALSMAP